MNAKIYLNYNEHGYWFLHCVSDIGTWDIPITGDFARRLSDKGIPIWS